MTQGLVRVRPGGSATICRAAAEATAASCEAVSGVRGRVVEDDLLVGAGRRHLVQAGRPVPVHLSGEAIIASRSEHA